MRFFLGKCGVVCAAAVAIVFCSCEEHKVGEMPEAQKEHVDLGKGSDEVQLVPVTDKSERSAPTHTPTPAEFFPEKTPH